MEQLIFLITGTLLLLAALWVASVLCRIWRFPRKLLSRWQTLSPDDLKRYTLLWEKFLKDELEISLNKNDLKSDIPALLGVVPHKVNRLQSYLIIGNPRNDFRPESQFYRPGEYFYGFSSLLLGCFVSETLRLSCGGRWKKGTSGLILELPGSVPGEVLSFSPVEKLANLSNLSSEKEKAIFREYLLDICERSSADRS